MKTSTFLRTLTLAVSLAGAALGATAQTQTSALSSIDTPRLQAIYLRCADESARSPLDSVDFAFCAAVGDALRDRAFDGSFERLIAWWHGARTPMIVEAEAAPGDATDQRASTASLQTMFANE